jgi:hypothetical protein
MEWFNRQSSTKRIAIILSQLIHLPPRHSPSPRRNLCCCLGHRSRAGALLLHARCAVVAGVSPPVRAVPAAASHRHGKHPSPLPLALHPCERQPEVTGQSFAGKLSVLGPKRETARMGLQDSGETGAGAGGTSDRLGGEETKELFASRSKPRGNLQMLRSRSCSAFLISRTLNFAWLILSRCHRSRLA